MKPCSDMLVRLYDLPHHVPHLASIKERGIHIRRALSPEKHLVLKWIRTTFGAGWASEVETTFSTHPISLWIATKDNQMIGFCAYDATKKGIAGPIGIESSFQGQSIGRSLLLTTLHDMFHAGYDYAVMGWASEENQKFFNKACQAQLIAGSEPTQGMYRGMLRE